MHILSWTSQNPFTKLCLNLFILFISRPLLGDIDIFITPLSLESLQRFIDALTPTLASVHPLTVLNHLHMSCIGIVEAANVLKRDQYLSQFYKRGGSKRSTAERKSKPGDLLPCHTYEESIASQCGLEGVSFKVVKRAKFEREEDSPGAGDPSATTSAATGESKTVRDDVSSETVNIASVKPGDVSNKQEATLTPKGTRVPGTPGAPSTTNNDSSTQPTPPKDTSKALVPVIDANASSCVIDVKSVWFNFAAPPRTPITRSKIAYTRLDWNLLSTASPGITAWMNPSNRCVIRAVHALRCRYRRSTAVVTCLMSQALDESSVHMPVKSRYGRSTPMAKALQEDPSCQLCNILKKYLLLSPTGIESNLKEPDLPHLSTLRQGVIVLSRQWKNILYTPLLLEHNFKIKNHSMKPMNVTFAIPDPDEVSRFHFGSFRIRGWKRYNNGLFNILLLFYFILNFSLSYFLLVGQS
ncbi:hypothetical protein WDU94_005774 [Cyamophila willieti]